MTTQNFHQLLDEHKAFERGFRPHLGTRYSLYQVDDDVRILWCGFGRYVRTKWMPNVWLPPHCIQDDVVETTYFSHRKETWQLIERDVVWDEPSWLGSLTPASEAELLKFARGSWQRSCIVGNTVTFSKLRGRAADYGLSYRRSMQNLLKRIEAAGYMVVPVYGPRDGGPNKHRVYRSNA